MPAIWAKWACTEWGTSTKKKAQNFSPPAAGETPHPANAAPSDTQHLGLPGGAAGAMEAFMSFGESSIPERPVCAPAAPPATSLHDDPVEEAFMEKSKGHGHSPCPFFSSFYL